MGFFSVFLTALLFSPASWLAQVVETQTQGRIILGDAQGSLWRGSAFIGGAASRSEAVTPLLPGRFTWKLSPLVLIGKVDLMLANPAALSAPVHVSGNWSQWQVGATSINMPAERLVALGAPLNTLQPSGDMRLSWNDLRLERQKGGIAVAGLMTLDLVAMSSRLSPVKPLGSYQMTMALSDTQKEQDATIVLKTISGAMLLDGSGKLVNGRLQFSGTAQAADGQEEKLANLLNLLGQRRQQNGKTVIGLEFS